MDIVEKVRTDEIVKMLNLAMENPYRWRALYPIQEVPFSVPEISDHIDRLMENSLYCAVFDMVMHHRMDPNMKIAMEMLVYQKLLEDIRGRGVASVVLDLRRFLFDAEKLTETVGDSSF